ncbi:MAG: hypothetical protein AAF490_18495 [Chloroflexota bacterium]
MGYTASKGSSAAATYPSLLALSPFCFSLSHLLMQLKKIAIIVTTCHIAGCLFMVRVDNAPKLEETGWEYEEGSGQVCGRHNRPYTF